MQQCFGTMQPSVASRQVTLQMSKLSYLLSLTAYSLREGMEDLASSLYCLLKQMCWGFMSYSTCRHIPTSVRESVMYTTWLD